MKRSLINAAWRLIPLALATAFGAAFFGNLSAQAQNVEGQVIASEYGEYQIWASGINRFTFSPSSCQVSGGGNNFSAFSRGLPVRIVDPGNPAIDETVIAGIVDIGACSVQLTPVNTHIPPFYLTSGTGGLQEAINANLSSLGANTLILSAEWYRLGGSAAIISSVVGNNSLRLEDITTTPATWYQWNGSQYVAVNANGGVGSLNGLIGPLSIAPASSNVSVTQSGSTIQIGVTGTAGVSSINGDTTPAQHITGSGGINCNTTAGTTTCNYSGSAGSGTVGSGGPYNEGGYTGSSPATSVQPETNSYTLPLNLSTSQINTVLSTSNIRVHIQAGDAHTPFTNGTSSRSDKVTDDRVDVPVEPRSLKEWGAQCDLRVITGTLSGNTLTTSGLTSADTGKTLAIAGLVSGVSTAIEAPITYVNSTTATIPYSSPLTISTAQDMSLGHDDTAAISAAIAAQNYASFTNNIVLTIPIGNCLTHLQTQTPLDLRGYSPTLSRITSFPGESIFYIEGGSQEQYSSFALFLDSTIDPTQLWQYYDATGTQHSVAAVYQPTMQRTAFANDPVAPAWFTGPGPNSGGAINGVATVTNGSAAITVTSAAIPVVGQQIIFPYLSSIFSTTVSAVSGSAVTLAANYPGTTGTQQEWFAGTSAQTITTAIPATGRTFPMTVTVANTLVPSPVSESNIAGIGVVKIDGEEFSYTGVTRSPTGTNSITLTAGAQNSTTAAAHSSGAVIVPLNPFLYDSAPWPVVPTLNSGGTTPAGAEYYPGYNIGAFAMGAPCQNGASGCSAGPYQAEVDNLLVSEWPQFANGFDGVRTGADTTASFYWVGYPYASHFHNLNLFNTYCWVEGQPSYNTHYGSNTADGMSARDSSCHANSNGFVANIMAGGETAWDNWNTYSGGNPGTGAKGGAAFNLTFGWDDQTGGLGSQVSTSTFTNIYNEPGNVVAGGVAQLEIDCINCFFNGWEYSSGGDIDVGGGGLQFRNDYLTDGPNGPLVNYANNVLWDHSLSISRSPRGNTFGVNSYLNYSYDIEGCLTFNGAGGPCLSAAAGSSRAPATGQSADTFIGGNVTAPYVNPIEGFITPEEFGTNPDVDQFPFNVGWTFDNTAPITHAYAQCNLDGYEGTSGCTVDHYDNGEGYISIGPDQRLNGLYTPIIAVKSSTGASGTFYFYMEDATCTNSLIYNQQIPMTGTWTILSLPQINFTPYDGCQLRVGIGTGTVPTGLQLAFLDFAPVAQNFSAQKVTAPVVCNSTASGSTCRVIGSGVPTGCGTTYGNGSTYQNTSGSTGSLFYVCNASTWVDVY